MKTKYPILAFALVLAASADAQSVLLAGFDGNQNESTVGNIRYLDDPAQDAGAIGNFDMSLSTDLTGKTGFTGFDWAAGFQSSNATWGVSTFTTGASTANNNAVYATDTGTYTHTINMVLTNTGLNDITLDKFHIRVKRDGTNSPTGIRFTYASGDLTDTPGGNTLLDVGPPSALIAGYDLAFSSVVTDLTLAAGESATFTWVTEGGSGQRFRVDNIGVSGVVVSGGPDTDPPTPNPMTWASVPSAAGDSSITMTATSAADPSGVQYEFTRYASDGVTVLFTSPWQGSPIFTDTSLSPDTEYKYTVRARDLSANNNTTNPSTPAASATTDPEDTAAPTPNPMQWATGGVPAAVNDSSITMTAATASDPSGVEYRFARYAADGTTLLYTSPWQDSPEYTDTGLDPETTYNYTVQARDKASTPHEGAPSTPVAPATTDPTPVGPVLFGGFDGGNAINAPKQHPSAIGLVSMSLDTSLEPSGLNPGNFMQSSSPLWGTTDLDPDAENTGTHNCILFKNGPYDLFITVTNTSSDKDVTLEKLHWRSKRDTNDSDTHATITYVSGSLNDSLGTNTEFYLGGLGAIGHEFPLSDMMADYVLGPGETATFSWSIENGGAGVRWDNIAISGTISDSDYYNWGNLQNWTFGDPGTGVGEDFDHDGLSNDMERIFGLDPTNASSANPYSAPFDAANGTFSYTRRSQSITGLNFPVWFSTDLEEWYRDIYASETPGTPADDVEIVGVQVNPVLLSQPKLFVQLRPEPPVTLPAPELINSLGSQNSITLNFTEELYLLTATDPNNFTVELDGGGAVTVTGASLSEDKKTVTLTLGSTLALASTYNVTFSNLAGTTGVPVAGGSTTQVQTWDDDPVGIKVFILAGQSNMVGYGHSELGAGDTPGGIGTLRYLAQPTNNVTYTEYDYNSLLETPGDPVNSDWIARSDVKVWGENGTSGNLGASIMKGDLYPSFGATNGGPSDPWFGPEYAFGQILGDFYGGPTEDVLIIKASWGGHSLAGNFRPPSAVAKRGGEIGSSYTQMLANVRDVLENLGTEFPEWSGRGYQIVGFAWHQGTSDKGEPAASEYQDNLVDFINDVCAEFGKPSLPFVIATAGMTGAGEEPFPYSGYNTVERAQLWALGVAQPDNVRSTDTRPFWEEVADSPRDQGYHWNHNARSYFRVGKALGDDMVDLLSP